MVNIKLQDFLRWPRKESYGVDFVDKIFNLCHFCADVSLAF
jgi:hypothetical protein